jgi:lysophospholipase L1-like esterase
MTNRFLVLASILAILASTTALGASIHWIGTWSTAPQAALPAGAETFRNQTVRLIVHVSAGGKRLRIRVSNTFGEQPLVIGGAHVARRTTGAEINPASDRPLKFRGLASVTIPARSEAVSDPVDLDVPPLSDLAVSLYFPGSAPATTSHVLALQTNYVSTGTGDTTAAMRFPVEKAISSWPFLTGVDVAASAHGAAIVAFGSSLTDGDGSTENANRRWPDLLAERLQRAAGVAAELGVLNEGIIGNRLLYDSPPGPANPFGPILGESGLKRFQRDVLSQSGIKYVVLCLGVNDILFPAFPFTPPTETVTADDIIAGYRQLIARAHANGIRIFGTTIPPFEGARFEAAGMNLDLYTPDRDRTRMAVNEWIRHGGAFDGVVDFDQAVRDPDRPPRLLPAFAAEDHLHVNDAGNAAQAAAISLALFQK